MIRILSIMIFILPLLVNAQSLTENGKLNFEINERSTVMLFPQNDCEACYYYLPTELVLSQKNGKPEVSLLTWDATDGQEAGAILHFLLKFELTNTQQKTLKEKIRLKTESEAVIMGPVNLDHKDQKLFFDGDADFSEFLNDNLTNLPLAPTTPGAKMAFSFRFRGNEVDELQSFISDQAKNNVFVTVKYVYEMSGIGFHGKKMEHELKFSLRNIYDLIKA